MKDTGGRVWLFSFYFERKLKEIIHTSCSWGLSSLVLEQKISFIILIRSSLSSQHLLGYRNHISPGAQL